MKRNMNNIKTKAALVDMYSTAEGATNREASVVAVFTVVS